LHTHAPVAEHEPSPLHVDEGLQNVQVG